MNLKMRSKANGCWIFRLATMDIFVEEVEIEDPEEYIKKKFQGKEVSYDKTVLNDGTIIFDIVTSQIKQRCSFTEI